MNCIPYMLLPYASHCARSSWPFTIGIHDNLRVWWPSWSLSCALWFIMCVCVWGWGVGGGGVYRVGRESNKDSTTREMLRERKFATGQLNSISSHSVIAPTLR